MKRSVDILLRSLAFGLIFSIGLLSLEDHTSRGEHSDSYQAETEKSEQKDGDTKLIVTPAIPVSFGIDIQFQSYLLYKMVQQLENFSAIPVIKQVFVSQSKNSLVLFRRIISPNAP